MSHHRGHSRVTLGIGDAQRRILTQSGKIIESLKVERLSRKAQKRGDWVYEG